MKTTRLKTWTALALALATGWSATAQRNRTFGSTPTVPGPNDYNQFAQFITVRNIFNPQRYAIRGEVAPPTNRQPHYTPQFTLVGTMSYEKGMFAFFDSNQSSYRKVLYTSDTSGIAGYVATNISTTNVTLLSPDKKETVQLNIGDSMVQEGNTWLPRLAMAGRNGFSSGGSSRYDSYGGGESSAPAADASSADSTSGTSAAPSPALENNDVLKRLMQQRQQELK